MFEEASIPFRQLLWRMYNPRRSEMVVGTAFSRAFQVNCAHAASSTGLLHDDEARPLSLPAFDDSMLAMPQLYVECRVQYIESLPTVRGPLCRHHCCRITHVLGYAVQSCAHTNRGHCRASDRRRYSGTGEGTSHSSLLTRVCPMYRNVFDLLSCYSDAPCTQHIRRRLSIPTGSYQVSACLYACRLTRYESLGTR